MSSRSLNKVNLIGNLTRDPELRYTPQGTAVCSFGLATNRSWSTDAGEKREETEFHRIVAWNKLAELCAQLLFKGRKVYVEGRLQTRNWTAQDGSQRQVTEIVIEEMIILDSQQQANNQGDRSGYVNNNNNTAQPYAPATNDQGVDMNDYNTQPATDPATTVDPAATADDVANQVADGIDDINLDGKPEVQPGSDTTSEEPTVKEPVVEATPAEAPAAPVEETPVVDAETPVADTTPDEKGKKDKKTTDGKNDDIPF